MSQNKVHSVKGAIEYALNTDSGKRELNKTSYRDNKTGKQVYRNSAMAQAMSKAVKGKDDFIPYTPAIEPWKKSQKKTIGNHPKELYSWLKGR